MSLSVAVAGASGYAGGELLRLLAQHPELEVRTVTAHANAGQPLVSVHPNLRSLASLTFQETTAEVRVAISKGVAGGHLFFACDDAYGTHAELKAKGVEITEEPVDQPYGIDFGLRDPFGNHIRIAQMKSA